MTPNARGGRFGTPDSIDPARLFRLPVPMQAEGLRLLFEMGQTMAEVMDRTRLSQAEVSHLVEAWRQPFLRPGDSNHSRKEDGE